MLGSLSAQRPGAAVSRPMGAPARVVARRSAVVRAAPTAPGSKARPSAPSAANQLEALKSMSKVVADTGEIDAIRRYRPVDATTNPSLVYKAMQLPAYREYLDAAIADEKEASRGARPQAFVADRLAVNVGAEIVKLVPGRVSTEVDAHLSYDAKASVAKALRLVDLYDAKGVSPDRLYIKLASTWEGIRACEELQKRGIDTNMTLIFSFAQAAACADAGAALISPFVGRILDWYKKSTGRESYPAPEDPGVLSVKRIYGYYKQHGYDTIVMAASFRNAGEIRELAGCDNITIAPNLLGELEASTEPLPYALWPGMPGETQPKVDLSATGFELFQKLHNEDVMAVEKLAEGITNFAKDQDKLEQQIAQAIAERK